MQRKSRHWPFPVIKAPNKVMVCAAFVSALERSDLEFLKGLERLEHPAFERAGQHSGENFAIGGRHTREEEIDLVLIGREVCSGVHVPDALPRAPSSDLPLTIVANVDKKIDYGSVFLRLHWLGHFCSLLRLPMPRRSTRRLCPCWVNHCRSQPTPASSNPARTTSESDHAAD